MVLPLLRNDSVANGIEYLEAEGLNNAFLRYLRRQWLGQDISVYGTDQRTNNSVESFHRKLFARVGRPHPNIWALLDTLKLVEHGKQCDLGRLEAGVVLPVRRRPRYLRANARITRAEELLQEEADIPQFLRRVSHLADRLVRLFGPAEGTFFY